ncbi:MAG: carboxypeptidase regulatory-like domain-containing protein [Terracidiphilus sp.]
MRNLPKLKVLALCIVLMGALGMAHAIDIKARIKGTVTDPQGAVLAGVKVTATNEATGVKFDAVSGSDGGYLFPQLPIGTYTISVSANGFKSFTAKGIVLNVDQEYVEDAKLSVGSTAEVVEVAASPVQVDTSDIQLSNVVDSTEMTELPLIGRGFTGLELILPGVQASSDRFGTFSVSGGQTQQSEFLINGADTNDIALNTVALSPNLDAIDQFNLIDGPLNAEYDRNSGGIVSATIKEGSNHFHGDVYEFYRDTFLNTLSYYQKTLNKSTGKFSGVVSPYHQHIFGGTVGGPILHDKLFFFGAYEGTRQRTPQSGGSVDVYNTANLGGDFSADDNPVEAGTRPDASTGWGLWTANKIPSSITVQGCSTAGETWAQCAYDLGGVIPTSAFSTVANNLVTKYVPAPNNGTYGFKFNPVTVLTSNQYIGRIDYSINTANQITALGIYSKRPTTDTLPFTGASIPGFGDVNTLTIQQYTGDYVHQFNSTTVNDFAGHYTRFNFDAVEPQNKVSPASLGFNISPQDAAAASVPTISVGGTNVGFTLGFSTNGPQPRIDQVAQLDDNLSKVIGRHTFKFGYDGRRFNVHNPFYARNSGSFSFGNTGTFSTGDGAVDFLLGIPTSYDQNSGATIIAEAFLNYVFAQDTWKLTDKLTFSYGLGYSIDTPLHNLQYGGSGIVCIIPGQQSTVFANSPTSLNYGGDKGCTNSGLAKTKYSEFGPRVGFVYAPDWGAISGGPGKFSIRGGFGIYYDRSEEETALQTLATPPFGTDTSGAGIGGTASFADPFTDINGAGAVANPFPYTFPKKGDNVDFSALEPIYNISTYGSDFRAPYAENFQLSLEREFPGRVVARASYVGSLARHNQSTTDANPITPAGHAACVADTTYCSGSNAIYREEQSYFFPENTLLNSDSTILDIGQVDSTGSSNYHSLQVNIEKATTHNLYFQLSYTFAHALDTASSFENAGFGSSSTRGYNQFAPQLNYGDAAFDVRHRVVFSPIYVTPTLRRSAEWYNPINLALSGWEVSGIVTLASGFPFDVSYAGGSANSEWCPDFLNFYACPDAPNQVAPVMKSGNPRTRTLSLHTQSGAYVDKASWVNEPLGTFGNSRRDISHGPGINNTNMVLAKNIYLSSDKQRYVQLRIESDNVFNHTQFTNPSTTWNDSVLKSSTTSFGYISGTQSARLSQLAAKFYF